MKAPQFWHKKNIISHLLLPFSWLYLFAHNLKSAFAKPHKIFQPVLCVGNLTAGGTGKTPVVIAIGKILKKLNIDFVYLSGGYKGEIKNFTLVDFKKHTSLQVGDEPLLLSEVAPVFICKNRLFGAKEIAKIPSGNNQKKIIIMDDGMQNLSIKKDFPILIIDGKYGFGNGFAIPAGPLRENIKIGIKKASLVIIIGSDKHNIAQKYCQNVKVINAKIKPKNAKNFLFKSAVAFCGIGHPEKFFNSLKESNIKIINKFSYPDHYHYKDSQIKKMLNLANKNNANLVTTKKDWIRLKKEFQNQIKYFDIDIEFEDKKYLEKKLKNLVLQ